MKQSAYRNATLCQIVPRAPTAGPKLHILARSEAMNFHEPPRQVLDGRRLRMFGHCISVR